MRPKSDTLTAQELEIMKVIWPREQATVREVYDTLRERRSIAYTSVQTMMNVLESKGHLSAPGRRAGARLHTRRGRNTPSSIDGARVRGSGVRWLSEAAAGPSPERQAA